MIAKLVAIICALAALALWSIGEITGSTPVYWIGACILTSWFLYAIGGLQDTIRAQDGPTDPALVDWDSVSLSKDYLDGEWVFTGTCKGEQAYALAVEMHMFGTGMKDRGQHD